MPPSNEYLIMKVNACFQATAVGLNALDRAALRRWSPEKIGAINLTGFGEVATNIERISFVSLTSAQQVLVDRHEPFVPPHRKVFDLLEIQGRRFAFTDDRRPLAFLEWQRHRSRNCGVQFPGAVICQGDELFWVQCHGGMPTVTAGLQDRRTLPRCPVSK